MRTESFEKFDKRLSWNTKMYVLLTAIIVLMTYFINGNELEFTFAAICALFVVLFVETYSIWAHRFPRIWMILKWIIIWCIILLTLIGFTS
jgi:glucan phosphoethanolaminetransferase (alkaline phosphatase superfamily)